MNSTYKMFAVNEKIILYILFLIVLQFFYIFPTALYTDFDRFVSPCVGWQSNHYYYMPFFVVGVVLASLWQIFSIWLGVKLRIGIFWIASLYLVFKMYGTYEIVKSYIVNPCKVPTEYMHGILWPYDLQAFILLGPDIVSCIIFIAVFIACSKRSYWVPTAAAIAAFVAQCAISVLLWEYVRGLIYFLLQ